MPRISFYLLLLIAFTSCADLVVDEGYAVELELSGDMLFEGSNTFQQSATVSIEELAAHAGISAGSIRSVGVAKAEFAMSEADAAITESLLLQVVSDKSGLKTIGTLSPLSDPAALRLNVSESIDLLPFIKDKGTTWVLDLNLSEDQMDEMTINGVLTLRIEYKA